MKTTHYNIIALLLFLFSSLSNNTWSQSIGTHTPEGLLPLQKQSNHYLISFHEQAKYSSIKGLFLEHNLTYDSAFDIGFGNFYELKLPSGFQTQAFSRNFEDNPLIRFALPWYTTPEGIEIGLTDLLFVKIKSLDEQATLKKWAERQGLIVETQDSYSPELFNVRVPKNVQQNALQLANQLMSKSWIEFAEPNWIQKLHTQAPNDPFYSSQWALENVGSIGKAGADLRVSQAWNYGLGSAQIKVAIIDDGVDLSHEDLQANLMPGYDATGNGSSGNSIGDDSHGTACAGIVAAIQNNGIGITGVAPNCKIIPVRIAYSDPLGGWITSNQIIASGINWAWDQAGADILSNSYGGGSSSFVINEAIDNAISQGRNGKGSPVLFSAGNSNESVKYPARYEPAIAIGALSMCDERKSPFSCDGQQNWGSCFGQDLDVMAPGVQIYSTDKSGFAGYETGNYTPRFGGTSAACPFAAGVMALVLSANPDLTQQEARDILEQTCRKGGNYNYSNAQPDKNNGSWNQEMGYGVVNALEAVKAAQGNNSSTVHTLSLSQGWNMISTYLQPETPDMYEIWDAILDKVIIVKDAEGLPFLPSQNINAIGDWDFTAGYKVKVSKNVNLSISGDPIDSDNQKFPLSEGWSIIPYPFDQSHPIETILQGIQEDIILVKDAGGNIYLPNFGINDIGQMEPGKAYKIKLRKAVLWNPRTN